MDVCGKVALVTGGASGIGLEIVKELLNNKVKGIVIADINAESGEKIVNELKEKYDSGYESIFFQKTDVTLKQEYEDAFKATINKFGHLDIVVNNAGVANDVKYEKEISINMIGVTHGTALALKYMSKDKCGNGGVVVSTSSITAVGDMHSIPIYAATKAAIMHLMRGFGHPFYYEKSGIRMVAILPGATFPTSISCGLETLIPKSTDILKERPAQKPLAVARAALHVIKNAESATAWMIEGNKLMLLEFPDWKTYTKVIVDNVVE